MPVKQPAARIRHKLPYHLIDFRKNPELYRISPSRHVAWLIRPYNAEVGPLFRYKTPWISHISSQQIYKKFIEYRDKGEVVGCEVAKKFLQLARGDSRIHAMYDKGKTHKTLHDGTIVKLQKMKTENYIKAGSAKVFNKVLDQVVHDEEYQRLLAAHKEKYNAKELDWSGVVLEPDAKAELARWEMEKMDLERIKARQKGKATEADSVIYFN